MNSGERARGAAMAALAVASALVSLRCGAGGRTGSGGADSGRGGDASGHRDAGPDVRLDSRSEGHPDGPEGSVSGPARIHGAAQKGPLVLGSSVEIAAIDDAGAPSGAVYTAATTDDLGTFEVSFSYRGYVDIQAAGYSYDEVTGSLSTGPILLRALYDVTTGGAQSAYVNVVTHLAHDRAVDLMKSGTALGAAEAQAESELVSALGIGGPGFAPGGTGIGLNEIGTNDDSNAYLLAVSAVLIERVLLASGTSSLDANLQESLDTIASELASGGGTLSATLANEILAAEEALDIDRTADLFAVRLAAIGSMATPANLDRAVDSDGDGFRNTIDTCPLVANPDQSMVPAGVLCSTTRHTTFLPAAFPPGNVLAGDYAGTGHPGVLLQSAAGSSVSLGDGTGRFSPPFSITLPAAFVPRLAIDLDADGKVDVASESGWAAGDGTGHFAAVTPYETVDGGAVITAGLAIGDFNGDGTLDVAGMGPGGLEVLIATSPGVFGAAIGSPMPFADANAWAFAADLNDDSHLDIVEVGQSTGSAVALLGDGTGRFTASATATVAAANGAALADFDGDGDLDLAGWSSPSLGGAVQVLFGDGTGAFGSLVTTTVTSPYVAVGDYDSDGQADLWVGYPTAPCAPTVEVSLSRGRTFGSPQTLHATPATCGAGGALVSHDLNGDGTPDVVLLSQVVTGSWNLQGYVVGEVPDFVCAGTTCHGACVDTASNWFNCSACGDTCALGATCSASACACNGADAVCGDACVDESANFENCGKCGNVCALGGGCAAGVCVCPGAQVACAGSCVDRSTDPSNCGTCGHACPTGATCSGGKCSCPGSDVVCGGACVDTTADNANCGGCGTLCAAPAPSTAQCAGSRCQITLGSLLGGGSDSLVVDSSNVYWTGAGQIDQAPIGGGAITTLVSVNLPQFLTLRGSTLLWATGGVPPPNRGIWSYPLGTDGGASSQLFKTSAGAMVTAASSVYWFDVVALVTGPISGGTASTLASGQSPTDAIATDGASVYWLNQPIPVSPPSGTLMKVPAGGGASVTLASAQYVPMSLAVDATSLYWTIQGGGTNTGALLKMPRGGGATTTLASGLAMPAANAIAVDATSVYWVNQGSTFLDGTVAKVPLGGGAVTTLATNIANAANGFAVDATSVYFTTSDWVVQVTPK